MKTLDIEAYMQELIANLIEEFVSMYELSGAEISEAGAEKLVVAKHLLAQALTEIVDNN